MIRIPGNVNLLVLALTIHLGYFTTFGQETNQIRKLTNLIGKEISTDSINSFLDRQMEAEEVPGLSLAIINDGRVIYHVVKGYEDMENKKKVNDKTIFEGASLSKPLFAYFVMGFVEDGILDLDKPLHEYFPYEDIANDERYKRITARMVLSHTTGFPNWRSDFDENKLFIKFTPGTSFEYSGEGYQYLAKVLAHLMDTNDAGLEKLFQDRIAIPLGLKYTKFVQDDYNLRNKAKGYKDGKRVEGGNDPTVFGSAFSIHSEAMDFSKWLVAILAQQGLSKASFSELFKAQVEMPAESEYRKEGITDWTLGFAKATFPFGSVYGHGGNNPGFTSLFVLEPDTKWGYIIFTNDDQSQIGLQLLQYFMTE